MSTPARLLVVLGTALAAGAGARAQEVNSWNDAAGDACLRRTDTGNDGPINPGATLPDVLDASLCQWEAIDPQVDPYIGHAIEKDGHLFRLDLRLKGLVNPPGTLGLGGGSFDPLRFGPSPLYGFLDLDVDSDKGTGGELGGAATVRYLANAARFGGIPADSIGERAARWGTELDQNFYTAPQYERSGADFALVFCGCWKVTIVSEDGDSDGEFDRGETWIVNGRFFQRAAGYKDASACFGGSSFGLYDPWVNLRFSHDSVTDITTVTLVYALDMQGAAALAGEDVQPIDSDVGNHTSVIEALQDVIENSGGLSGPVDVLAGKWEGRRAEDYLDASDWSATLIVGTSYTEKQDSQFAWTDAGFDEEQGDVNGDGWNGGADKGLIQATIALLDGGPKDADGVQNGCVAITNFGPNFAVYDVDGDGLIGPADVAFYCPPDFNGDGALDVDDFIAFQLGFALGDPRADFNGDGSLDIDDFIDFQIAFGLGCP